MNAFHASRSGCLFLVLVSVLLLSACGDASDQGPSIQDIPEYPGALEGESMEQGMAGFIRGSLKQYSTSDSFDEVMAFYEEALGIYPVEIMSNQSELGRQVAITIPKEHGVLTVAIQEFVQESTVNITFMDVGS